MGAFALGPQVAIGCLHSAVANALVVLGDGFASYPASIGEQFEVVSSDNTQDKAAGTGMLTVGINYLDATGAPQFETRTLNGTTAVASVGTSAWRYNDFYGQSFGTGGANVGAVTLRKVTAGGDRSKVNISRLGAAMGQYTVPLGYELLFLGGHIGAGASAANVPLKVVVQVEAEIDRNTGLYNPGSFVPLVWATGAGARQIDLSRPDFLARPIPALATVRVRAVTESATGIEVSGMIYGYLRPTG